MMSGNKEPETTMAKRAWVGRRGGEMGKNERVSAGDERKGGGG